MNLTELLKKEMLPAMGCTEPAASALAGAKAREILKSDEISRIQVYASRDMVKNAMGVGIPNCNLKGILAAVALGVAGGDTSRGLSILSDVDSRQIEKAKNYKIQLNLVENVVPLYVSVKIFDSNENYSISTVSGEHDRFSHLERNGEITVDLPLEEKHEEKGDKDFLKTLTLDDIIDYADNADIYQLGFVSEAIRINMEIAEKSVSLGFGLEVGKTTFTDVENPASLAQAFELGASLAAAGSDARMSGCNMPVIINSGSGNQGITVTVPVHTVGSFLKCSEEKIIRAVCVSELVGLVLTARKNRLSALCGAFTASIGTACAYIYLMNKDRHIMDRAVNTMVGNLTGIICDGAKSTCALKIYSCLEAAALSVKLALRGFSPAEESGIVGRDSLESITYLSRISSEGMLETDKTIVEIMLNKKC